MNILFLTLVQFESLQEHNIYTDLLREFVGNGHKVYVISPIEKRFNQKTHIVKEKNAIILKLRIGNTQKTNIIEKGISTIMIEPLFKMAIKSFFSNVRFDLVLYSTPPITLVKAIEYVKKRDNAKTYLMLKDIFPQNAIDIGMMTKTGIRSGLYKYFRKKEKKLYRISDRIGCMSQANVKYVIANNRDIDYSKVEICPNCIEVFDKSVSLIERNNIRKKYNLPLDKNIFVYGGNLGKPQGIPFLARCIKKCSKINKAFFLIIGDGTEFQYLNGYINKYKLENVLLLKRLPKEDYDNMVGACDVGLIFLDFRFSIPNFPSRLLSYMQAKIPVFAATDPNTDLGNIICDNKFGWWCKSDSSSNFYDIIKNHVMLDNDDFAVMGERAYKYAIDHYNVKNAYECIMDMML